MHFRGVSCLECSFRMWEAIQIELRRQFHRFYFLRGKTLFPSTCLVQAFMQNAFWLWDVLGLRPSASPLCACRLVLSLIVKIVKNNFLLFNLVNLTTCPGNSCRKQCGINEKHASADMQLFLLEGTGSSDNHALENELRDKGRILSSTISIVSLNPFCCTESFVEFVSYAQRILYLSPSKCRPGTAVEFHECCLATGATATPSAVGFGISRWWWLEKL